MGASDGFPRGRPLASRRAVTYKSDTLLGNFPKPARSSYISTLLSLRKDGGGCNCWNRRHAQTRPVWTKVTADSILQKVDKYRREGAQEVYDNKEIIDQVTLLDLIERHRYLAWQHDLLKSRNTQIWHVKEMYRCIRLLRITKGFRNDALRSSEYAKNNALGQYCALRTRAEESSAVPLAEALEVLDNQATTSRRRVEDLSSVLSTRSGSSTFVNSSDPARGTDSDTAGTLTQSDVQELDRALDQFENSVVQYGALLDQASAMYPRPVEKTSSPDRLPCSIRINACSTARVLTAF